MSVKTPSAGPLPRTVRGIRDTIPSGYILGRTDSGDGRVQLLSMSQWCCPPSTVRSTVNNLALLKSQLKAVAAHSILLGEGTSNFGAIGPAASGDLLIAQGATADPAFQPLSGDAVIMGNGDLTVTGLQGHTVSATNPTNGQALIWNGTSWTPTTITTTQYAGLIVDGTDMYVATSVSLADPELVYSGGLPIYTKNPPLVAGLVRGVTDGSDAPAGFVGEFLQSIVSRGSGTSLTTNVAANVTSLSLTAGDWDVWGNVGFDESSGGGTTSVSTVIGWTSLTSATLPTPPNNGAYSSFNMAATVPAGDQVLAIGIQRISVPVTTTVYLSSRASFTVSSLTNYGVLSARRVR